MQGISLVNQLLTDLSDLRYSQSPKKRVADNSPAAQPEKQFSRGVTVELSYQKSEFSYSGTANDHTVSVQLMEASLSGRVMSFAKTGEPPNIFQAAAPSPETVANRVLGFVESRIASEAQKGASEEQLRKLFTEGLAGVNQGYGEAIEEIEQRGLMTEGLGQEIDAGYKLIENGFDSLREKYLSGNSGSVKPLEDKTDDHSITEENSDEHPRVSAPHQAPPETSEVVARPRRSRLAEALAIDRSRYAANDVGISITTRDGDRILIQAGQLSTRNESLAYSAKGRAQDLSYSQNSVQLEGFNLLVEGNLDDGEQKALESLLLQVEDIASSFFAGDLDKAFAAAIELDVDMSEIASYAVSMTSLRYQAVEAAYQQQTSEVDSFKPLTRLVPQFAKAVADAAGFAHPKQLVGELINKILEPVGKMDYPYLELFSQFRSSVLEKLIN